MQNRLLIRLFIALAVLVPIGAYIHHASHFRPAKNFHVVDEGKFYRSAQLKDDEIDEVVKKYGIKTVINLRGSQPGEWWFDAEKAMLEKLGVRMENLGFSTEHVQFKDDWVKYLDILKSAERPILVHCRSGADRTGEASALYMIEHMGKSKDDAMAMLSPRFLHVSLLQPAKKLFVSNYQGYDWVKNIYDPCASEFRTHAGNRCPSSK